MIKNMTEKQQHAWRTAADLVRENPLVTIGEVAKDAGCSPASITLLARVLAFQAGLSSVAILYNSQNHLQHQIPPADQ